MYSGKCLCGCVQFQISGPISSIIHCHCSLCRKSSGTAYATNGFVYKADFIITEGTDNLTSYETKPGMYRHFCTTCGSPVYSSKDIDKERIRLRLGLLDDAILERPSAHIFMASRANWDEIDANIPRYNEIEPNRK